MNRLLHLLKRYWPILALIAIETLLVATNYKPGTYVVGWDNLFPEFNFGLNIKRALFAIWQEYRGLGYEDGMSHAANLPHYVFLYLLSFVLPQTALRYAYIFLTHLVGGIGMYALAKRLFGQKPFALVAALLYQYNFAVLQMFYLPFEPFITHFAFLPWLILTMSEYIHTRSKKPLLFFALLSFLSTPQAHVPTVFIVYMMIAGLFLLFELIHHKKAFLPILVVIFVTFATNAYWGLPFGLSTYKNSQVIASSKNNQMATEDIFLQNHQYGDFVNTALMRSFSLEFVQFDHTSSQRDYMMATWRNYIDKPIVNVISWGFFTLSILGLVISIYKKERSLYPYICVFAVTFLIIGNDIPVLSSFSYLLRTYVPFFQNVFRFVYTKFFIAYAFSFSILLAISLVFVTEAIYSATKKHAGSVIFVLLVLCLGLYTIPSFTGNFLHSQLRVPIPQEYFDVFNFFQNEDPSERIAVLPAPWYWAWTQYTWGVIGSGFEWFGIEQPTIDVAFDPWSQYNENFYWEVNQAIYTSDIKKLKTVLEKYDVTWILLDEQIIDPEKPAGELNIKDFERSISTSDSIKLVKSFNRIKVYKVVRSLKPPQSISIVDNVPNIGPKYTANDADRASRDYSIYTTDLHSAYDAYYPYRSLFTGKSQKDLEFNVEENENEIRFVSHIPNNLTGYKLVIPPYNPDSLIDINKNALNEMKRVYPSMYLDGKLIYTPDEKNEASAASLVLSALLEGNLEIRVPKIFGYYSYDSSTSQDLEQPKKSCNAFNTGLYTHDLLQEQGKKILRLTSINSSNCINFDLPVVSQRQGYLMTVNTKNLEGRGFFVSLTNKQTNRTLFDTYLDAQNSMIGPNQRSYVVIPPMEPYSIGYNINVDNISIGRVKTVNDLKSLTLNQIPYDFLTQLKLVKPGQLAYTTDTQAPSQGTLFHPVEVSHPYSALYSITALNSEIYNNAMLVLWQAYDPGWMAFQKTSIFPYYTPLTDHVLVNNWANGWEIDKITKQQSDKVTIVVFFWPQLLQWIGFGLLPVPFIWAARYRKEM